MAGSLVDADSLLAVDVGTVVTRATLFDVVEGHYRFVAAGQAPSTTSAPFRDISQGVHHAIENLQTVTGRIFLGPKFQLIMPTREGKGVDTFAATLSAGPAIKTAVVGLLDDVSLESTRRLARRRRTATRIWCRYSGSSPMIAPAWLPCICAMHEKAMTRDASCGVALAKALPSSGGSPAFAGVAGRPRKRR